MLTTLVILAVLIVPGAILTLSLGQSRLFLFKAFLYSYFLLLANLTFAKWINYDSLLPFIYAAEVALLFIAISIFRRRNRVVIPISEQIKRIRLLWPECCIIVVVAIYIGVVGPYMEIPADVFEHLGAIRRYSDLLHHGIHDMNQPWYLLYAIALKISGQSINETIVPFTVTATALFSLLIATLAREIYSDRGYSQSRVQVFVLSTVFLTILTFGTSIFSFVRYYVFAPAYLVYPIYLFLAYEILSLVSNRTLRFQNCLTIGLVYILGVIVAYLVHKQEALFMLITLAFAILYKADHLLFKLYVSKSSIVLSRNQYLAVVVLGISLISFALVNYLPFLSLDLSRNSFELENNTLVLTMNKSIAPILVADPRGRVLETLGVWGLSVIIFYFLAINNSKKHIYFSCLIWIPIVLVFNPIFTHMFVRVAGPDVLWRLIYMIPLGFIAAHLIIELSLSKNRKSWKRMAVLALVVLLIVPWGSQSEFRSARVSTLLPVDELNSTHYFYDLIEYLSKYSNSNILTDPITGYVLRALTKHTSPGFKFHGSGSFIRINYEGYSNLSFKGYKSWLFVLNQRNGSLSETGGVSGHWPKDVLVMSKYYSAELLEFFENPPEHIALVWENQGIRVYEIEN